MSNFPILDLVAGMVFFYFLLSLISSCAVEMILTGLKARAKMLEAWLTTIFKENIQLPDGTTVPLSQAIMDHDSLTALSPKKKTTAYIAAANFTTALFERISFDPANKNSVPASIDDFIRAIQNTTALPTELKRVFAGYANEAKATYAALATKTGSEIDLFMGKVETWFNTNMDRVTDKLKTRYSRPFTALVAAIVVIALNADSISIAKYLYNNPEARAKIAATAYEAAHNDGYMRQARQADSIFKANPTAQKAAGVTLEEIQDSIATQWKQINSAKAILEQNSVPLGWSKEEDNKSTVQGLSLLMKIAGLLFTWFALIMGAPFWFQVLNKVADLRGAGKKPGGNGKKSKK